MPTDPWLGGRDLVGVVAQGLVDFASQEEAVEQDAHLASDRNSCAASGLGTRPSALDDSLSIAAQVAVEYPSGAAT